jgi:hypothetical protein
LARGIPCASPKKTARGIWHSLWRTEFFGSWRTAHCDMSGMFDALRIHTANAAYTSFDERRWAR